MLLRASSGLRRARRCGLLELPKDAGGRRGRAREDRTMTGSDAERNLRFHVALTASERMDLAEILEGTAAATSGGAVDLDMTETYADLAGIYALEPDAVPEPMPALV
ncbi:MAG: hypothetical protein ACYDAY_09565 [Candidatus Dormibacteria bacterium]